MSFYRLLSLIRKEVLQILRDPNTLFIAVMIPIVELFLLGYAATNDVRNVPLAVWDQDRGPAARALLDAFQAADYFRLAYVVDSGQALQDLLDAGRARAGLIIPPDYTDQIRTQGRAQVAFVLDGSDPTVAAKSLSAAELIGQAHATRIQSQRWQRMRGVVPQPPLEVRTQVWYNPDLKDAYFMVPGLIGVILSALSSVLTATAVVRERERGTIEQLIVTPIRPWELVVGKLIPYVFIAVVDTLEVLFIGSVWFKVPIRSPLMDILLLSGLFLISGLGVGLLASTLASTQQEAILMVWMTILPSIFLSGFFFPIEAMPKALQWLSYLFPLRYYLRIIRAQMLKGAPLSLLRGDIAALALFALVIMGAAAVRFRKRLD
ncbi:MAG TPA: ABC transporter permease [Anaerolineae bacterium]|nr:ABC transporter permease [Anaerolineae bacterium]HID83528.1 ABC transporter permease [Anaerolineales bacterium]HIQ08080.1 ABC transporter permease [Anaerolineaceae bacterium]